MTDAPTTFLAIALFAPGNLAAEPSRLPPVDKHTAEACQAAADAAPAV